MEGADVLWGAAGVVAALLCLVALFILFATWRSRRSSSPVTRVLRVLQAAIRARNGAWKTTGRDAPDLVNEAGEFSFCTRDGATRCYFRSDGLTSVLIMEHGDSRLELAFHEGRLSSMKLDGISFGIEEMEMRTNDALTVILLKDVRRAVGFPVGPEPDLPPKSYSKAPKKKRKEEAEDDHDDRPKKRRKR